MREKYVTNLITDKDALKFWLWFTSKDIAIIPWSLFIEALHKTISKEE
jgi:hypothetical protein